MSRTDRLPRALYVFLCLLAGLTAACIGTELICIEQGRGYPYNWPLLPYVERFQDIGFYIDRYSYYHSRMFYDASGQPNLYPAPATTIYKLLFLTGHAGFAFVVVVALFLAAFMLWLGKGLLARGLSRRSTLAVLAVTALCSFPFAFEFRQGNIEGILWGLIALCVYLSLRRLYVPTAILIGIVASMKLYPFALLGLLVAKKRWREVGLSVVVSLGSTVAGLWLACPDIAYSWKRTQEGVALFQQGYTIPVRAIAFDHSLFALVKRVLDVIADHTGRSILDVNAAALQFYLPIAGLFGLYVCFIRSRTLPVVNQIICIVAAMILLPPTSFDYTLIHLYMPWALLALCAAEFGALRPRGIVAAFVCFAILFAAESEIIYHYVPMGGQIKAVALLCLIAIAMRFPFRSSYDEAAEPLAA